MIRLPKRLELSFWSCLPVLITVFLLILCLAPRHVGGLSSFMPALPMIAIFYWGMLHAHEMPYWFVFLVGIVLDAATGTPLGLSSLSLILFLALLHAQRKYIHKEGFIIKWGYFSALLLAIDCIDWIFMSLYNSGAQNIMPVFIQWFLTTACYPLLHKVFDGLSEYISHRRWQVLHGH